MKARRVIFSVQLTKPRGASVQLDPGKSWRPPDNWRLAAVVQNVCDVPLYIKYEAAPTKGVDYRQIKFDPDIIDWKDK